MSTVTMHSQYRKERRGSGRYMRTVRKEFAKHEFVIRFLMVTGQTDVFVHVESDNIFERELALFHHAYEDFVCGYGG